MILILNLNVNNITVMSTVYSLKKLEMGVSVSLKKTVAVFQNKLSLETLNNNNIKIYQKLSKIGRGSFKV